MQSVHKELYSTGRLRKGAFYIVTYIFNLMVCSFSPRTLLSTLESQFHLHAHTDIPGQ